MFGKGQPGRLSPFSRQNRAAQEKVPFRMSVYVSLLTSLSHPPSSRPKPCKAPNWLYSRIPYGAPFLSSYSIPLPRTRYSTTPTCSPTYPSHLTHHTNHYINPIHSSPTLPFRLSGSLPSQKTPQPPIHLITSPTVPASPLLSLPFPPAISPYPRAPYAQAFHN